MKERIKEINARLDELRSAYMEYDSLIKERRVLNEKLAEEEKYNKRRLIVSSTQFIEPCYPYIGSEAKNGSAVFESEKQANELMYSVCSYEYGYELDWNGPGKYYAIPNYRYDHHGDIIYTCTFTKTLPYD